MEQRKIGRIKPLLEEMLYRLSSTSNCHTLAREALDIVNEENVERDTSSTTAAIQHFIGYDPTGVRYEVIIKDMLATLEKLERKND